MAAAVSDFIPEFINEKMDRRKGSISVDLTPNQDILKELAKKFPDSNFYRVLCTDKR